MCVHIYVHIYILTGEENYLKDEHLHKLVAANGYISVVSILNFEKAAIMQSRLKISMSFYITTVYDREDYQNYTHTCMHSCVHVYVYVYIYIYIYIYMHVIFRKTHQEKECC